MNNIFGDEGEMAGNGETFGTEKFASAGEQPEAAESPEDPISRKKRRQMEMLCQSQETPPPQYATNWFPLPESLDQFVGQKHILKFLRHLLDISQQTSFIHPPILFSGPPRIGKRHLASLYAKAQGVSFRPIDGRLIENEGDVAGLLTVLRKNDILYIEHAEDLSPDLLPHFEACIPTYRSEESLKLDVILDSGPNARPVRLNLPPFSIILATENSTDSLPAHIRHLISYDALFSAYSEDEVVQILVRCCGHHGLVLDNDAASRIAKVAQFDVYAAIKLMRWIAVASLAEGLSAIGPTEVDKGLEVVLGARNPKTLEHT